jgi:hypothetical protein
MHVLQPFAGGNTTATFNTKAFVFDEQTHSFTIVLKIAKNT